MKLAGTKEEAIFNIGNELLTDEIKYASMSEIKNPYGDDESSKRIVNVIKTGLKW